MTDPLATPPPVSAVDPGHRLRRMRWWDIAAVMPIEGELFADDRWSEPMLWNELAQSHCRHYVVAEVGDELAGYAGLAVYDDEASVQTLGVRRDQQGRGIGSALLDDLLGEADRRGVRRTFLEVRTDNRTALRLYERCGFGRLRVRRRYYRDGSDALEMCRDRPAHPTSGAGGA